MRIEGRYDAEADIAWLRFEGYHPATVVGEEIETGLREIDPATGKVVGLEYWRASETLPIDFSTCCPRPASPQPSDISSAREPLPPPCSAA